jgi:hypothetical protein
VAGQIVRLWALADEESLLLIILDDLRRANLRVVWVKPDITKGTSLAQEVPALVQFDLDLREPPTIGLGKFPLLMQSLLLCDKALNIIEDRLIPDLILHGSLLSRGQAGFYVTPNRNWGQRNLSGLCSDGFEAVHARLEGGGGQIGVVTTRHMQDGPAPALVPGCRRDEAFLNAAAGLGPKVLQHHERRPCTQSHCQDEQIIE